MSQAIDGPLQIRALDQLAQFPALVTPLRQVVGDLCEHRGYWLALEFSQVLVRPVVQVGEVVPLGNQAREQLLLIAAPGHERELEALTMHWEPTRSFGNGTGVGEHFVYVAWDLPRAQTTTLSDGWAR